MSGFRKYMHIERYGNEAVQGIELGTCYIFPKIDGTNGSVWLDQKTGDIQAGSRNRHLTLGNDNAGFLEFVRSDDRFVDFFKYNRTVTLYGEWLVPHSLKTYREDAWRKFYIFDVFDNYGDNKHYIPFDDYKSILEKYSLEFITPLSIIKNSSYDQLVSQLEKNTFLIKEGNGIGEGIVIKNYDYENKYGRQCFAKIVTNSFKEKHVKEMGASIINGKNMKEQELVDSIIDHMFVSKTYSKIVNEKEGWNARYIPMLLGIIYHDMINEELWDFIKLHKNPTINFRTLNILAIKKVKEIMPEIF